jgi:hypothetical protein
MKGGKGWGAARGIVSVAVLCVVAGPAGAQTDSLLPAGGPAPTRVVETTIVDLLAGSAVPLTMKLRELTPEWRRMTVTGEAMLGMGGAMQSVMQSVGSLFGGGKLADAIYTRGATLRMGSEWFLIGYRLPAGGGMDFGSLIGAAMTAGMRGVGGAGAAPKHPEANPITAETDLSLVLVNVKSIAAIGDIRAFDLNEAIQSQAGGLMDMIMREAMKEAFKEPSAKPRAPATKPVATAKPKAKR